MDALIRYPATVTRADKLLLEKIRHEVQQYAAVASDALMYSILDDDQQHYAVLLIPDYPREFVSPVVFARVDGDKIIIEHDSTDKPLVDALMINAGIPREQIILAYQGEHLSEQSET